MSELPGRHTRTENIKGRSPLQTDPFANQILKDLNISIFLYHNLNTTGKVLYNLKSSMDSKPQGGVIFGDTLTRRNFARSIRHGAHVGIRAWDAGG